MLEEEVSFQYPFDAFHIHNCLGGSGKTTFASAIINTLGRDNITYIPHDNYYKDLSHLSEDERDRVNFDHPNALETKLLINHLKKLKSLQSVEMPSYDFSTHTRRSHLESVSPRRVILVEGILLFADSELNAEIDIKVFVDTDPDIRFIRRMRRDISERGRNVEGIIEQYMTTVRPMHLEYVEPSKRNADIIVPSGLNSVALDIIVSKLQSYCQ